MKTYLMQFLWMLLGLLVLFAILDFFNLTSWLVYPYSNATGKNRQLTNTLGNSPAVGGG